MTICHNPACPTSHDLDEFGRRMAVQHNGITQPRLGPVGHHLLNRQMDGTLGAHLAGWGAPDLERAANELGRELTRVDRLAEELELALYTVRRRREALKTR